MMNVALTEVSDSPGSLRGDFFKVAIFNLAFVGAEITRLRAEVKGVLVSMVSADDARTCGNVVCPLLATTAIRMPTSPYKSSLR